MKMPFFVSAVLLGGVAACAAPVDPEDQRRHAQSVVPRITRGPYLQTAHSTGLVLRWQTDVASSSRVQVGVEGRPLTSVVDDPVLLTEHAITLTGLVPATRYRYAVGTAQHRLLGDDTMAFQTQPVAGTARAVRFFTVGDGGWGNTVLQGFRDAYLRLPGSDKTDAWLLLGDNGYYSGLEDEYQSALFEPWNSVLRRLPVWSTLGNHETYGFTDEDKAYFRIFNFPEKGEAGGVPSGNEAYYSFDIGPVHFVCLDSMLSDKGAAAPMATWLEADLSANPRDWVVAFFHHPIYSKGTHDSDAEPDLVALRTVFAPLLERFGVDLVLNGHSHNYERSHLMAGHSGVSTTLTPVMVKDPGMGREGEGTGPFVKPRTGAKAGSGSIYVVAGSSSVVGSGSLDHPAMAVSLSRGGGLVVDIEGDRLKGRFLTSTGTIDDEFVLLKPSMAPATIPNVAPVVTVTTDKPTCAAPCTLAITATAQDSDGSVAYVQFSSRGQLLATVKSPPFVHSWSLAEPPWMFGFVLPVTVTAQAFDNRGGSSSATTAISVTTTNLPPVVSFTTDVADTTAPATITVSAEASDPDGRIVSLELVDSFQPFKSFVLTGAQPYKMIWKDVEAGSYELRVRATDDRGAVYLPLAAIRVRVRPVQPDGGLAVAWNLVDAGVADAPSGSDLAARSDLAVSPPDRRPEDVAAATLDVGLDVGLDVARAVDRTIRIADAAANPGQADALDSVEAGDNVDSSTDGGSPPGSGGACDCRIGSGGQTPGVGAVLVALGLLIRAGTRCRRKRAALAS